MADGRGGYRAPSTPAPVSGPGPYSRRTDGGQPIRDLPNARYGENAQFVEQQQAAPLASAPGPQGIPAPPASPAMDAVVPFGAPSQRPHEPVTAGANAGPGPGMDALALPNRAQRAVANLQEILSAMELVAASPYSSDTTRDWIRHVRMNAMLEE